ncbi:hypothetical protein HDU97_002499, partial [Phlyctochytrium planicorne]
VLYGIVGLCGAMALGGAFFSPKMGKCCCGGERKKKKESEGAVPSYTYWDRVGSEGPQQQLEQEGGMGAAAGQGGGQQGGQLSDGVELRAVGGERGEVEAIAKDPSRA